ncbi:SDR family oxidoreductase [Roseovarius sp. D0-M9]|uniref:SDR family oxidoreductase n=1 Tax=Roseovarius sp. D0-M9 TaxID=3127117 RepID=UPI00300FCF1C
MNVSGKKAVVFGGTSGIGLAAAQMLADGGASVIVVSRDPSKTEQRSPEITTRSCDVLDGAAVEALLTDIGPIDILVSSATGGDRAIGPFLEMDMEGYKASFDKLWGYANVVRYGASHVADGGSITLVSGAPARNCQPGQSALSSVGGAVEAMVRAVAREFAPRIRINVVSPGIIDTPMVSAQGAEREALYDEMTRNHLIPRAGTATEVAEGILFVIKNDFVTGTTVDVDGGWLLS